MEYAYFKADEKTSEMFFDDWKKTQAGVEKITEQIKTEYNADTFWQQGSSILGFVLNGHGNVDRRGFKREEVTDGGTPYTVYTPNGRFKEGKAFNDLVEQRFYLINKNPGFSDYVVRRLGVDQWVTGHHSASRTGQALYHSGAGFRNGVMFIRVPISEEKPGPDIIDGLLRIKKSEFIALSEE